MGEDYKARQLCSCHLGSKCPTYSAPVSIAAHDLRMLTCANTPYQQHTHSSNIRCFVIVARPLLPSVIPGQFVVTVKEDIPDLHGLLDRCAALFDCFHPVTLGPQQYLQLQ